MNTKALSSRLKAFSKVVVEVLIAVAERLVASAESLMALVASPMSSNCTLLDSSALLITFLVALHNPKVKYAKIPVITASATVAYAIKDSLCACSIFSRSSASACSLVVSGGSDFTIKGAF